MKNLLLLIALSFGLIVGTSYAKDKETNEEELLRKSQLTEPALFNSGSTSYPRNFTPTTAWSSPTNAAISTGYYWVDDREILDGSLFPNMRPSPVKIDTGYQPELWRKILPGPRMKPASYWQTNKTEGLAFFRQPADGDKDGDYFTQPTDSVDEAIAGPIPLGLNGGFYFNGVRYDSFYVSTNGIIALTNRRYFYDANGNRTIPNGSPNAYDPMSMDYFAGGFRGRDTLWLRKVDNSGDSIDASFKRIPVRDANGIILFKDGLNDPAPDNFGYQFSVLGADPVSTSYDRKVTTNGIRSRGGDLMTGINQNSRTAMIAVFWGDLMLSQYNPNTKTTEEHGRVMYKRTSNGDSLIIAIYNAQPKGTLAVALNAGAPINADVPMNTRPGDVSYATADANIVLSNVDSSVTIHYTRISDSVSYLDPSTGIYLKASAREAFRYNTTAGVRGFARHVNFGKGGLPAYQPWAGEYIQGTTYWDRYRSDTLNIEVMYPNTMSAVKYKQWKNTLRIQSLNYRVRSLAPAPADSVSYSVDVPAATQDDYELLAGHNRLGQIQPFAIVQNLSNEIQGPGGINFMKQDHTFRVRFLIRNSVTGRSIYNRVVPINANCLSTPDANLINCNGDATTRVRLVRGTTVLTDADFRNNGFTGIPAYYGVQVQFPPFEPNQFIDEHIGKMRAMAVAEPIYPANNVAYEDSWPFDDTLKTTMYVMRRFYDQHPDPRFRVFDDDVSEYFVDLENGDHLPSVWKWVNINAIVNSGNTVSKYPLPPRRGDTAMNYFLGVPGPVHILQSPTIRMNRIQRDRGSEPLARYGDNRAPQRNGDEIRSFPIDLRGKYGTVLTLSVQRTIFNADIKRGFGDRLLVGPEPRVVRQGNVLNPYVVANSVSNNPDELVVEFARPSDDEMNGITNIPLANWRHHPYRRGTSLAARTDMAALTLYGAGGYLIGFLEKDKDSVLAPPGAAASGLINSLRANLYDDGMDLEYKKFAIPIPDTFINWRNNGAKHFRFRIKVYATNGRKCTTCIADDNDDFFVDNIRLLYRSEITDLEISSVKVNWQYTLAPASQATSIPLSVVVSNNTNLNASNFAVKLRIYRTDINGNLLDKDPIYCRTQTISNLTPNGTLNTTMPAWNARKSQRDTVGYYRLFANLISGEPDLIPKNDSTYSDFTLRFSSVFAYDPAVAKSVNSLDDFITPKGKGLNFTLPLITIPNPIPGLPAIPVNSPRAGRGSLDAGFTFPTNSFSMVEDATGAVGGNGSGSIAAKFTLLNADTIRGFSIYWAGINKAADQITIRLFEGGDNLPNNSQIKKVFTTRRGGPNFANIYDKYVDYTFDEPIILPNGVYWLGVSQDGETGMEIAASSSRSGMRTTNVWADPSTTWWGEKGISLNLDKSFRKVTGGQLVNDNLFAFQNVTTIGAWMPFTPSMGNPAFAHLDHLGFRGNDLTTFTMTRGSWIPMIRPIFGNKAFGEALDAYEWCPDYIPVELYTFTGNVRNSGIDLYWETASELNNYGFYVERRIAESKNEFKQIGFVEGVGNSSAINRYNFLDKDVNVKTTYEYRLRQLDKDGSQDCFTSNIVTLTYDKVGDLVLEPNSPNPFVNETLISFNLPQSQEVRLEVIDMLGNTVKVIENGFLSATKHTYIFDGNDSNGKSLPTGTYIYKLTAGNETQSGKMSIIR
jgi:hypothetical protein